MPSAPKGHSRPKWGKPHKETKRGNSAQRGYDAQWRKARARYLAKNPICIACHEQGRLVEATVVDHIQPHQGDKALFWSQGNWQPLCASCHSRKTAKHDGGFGNLRGA